MMVELLGGVAGWWPSILLGLLVLVVLWYWTREKTKRQGEKILRTFGGFEYVFHDIVKINGHHNMSLCAKFKHRFEPTLVEKAVKKLQERHVLLQASVINEEGKTPAFTRPDEKEKAELCPVQVFQRTSPTQWQRMLEEEINTPTACMRCTLLLDELQGDDEKDRLDDQKYTSDLIMTFRHDIMDGKSVALLCIEFIELYRQSFIKEHYGEEALAEDRAKIGHLTLTSDKEDPLPPSVETFLGQRWPPLLLKIVHVGWFMWAHTFMLILPGRLPHTSTPQKVKNSRPNQPLWTSGLIHRELTHEQTRLLTQKCKREGATIGTALYATAMTLSASTVFEGGNAKKTSIWGVLVIDMRAHIMGLQHKWEQAYGKLAITFNPVSPGMFISTLDFVYRFHKEKLLATNNDIWELARKSKRDIMSAFKLGKQFTSVMAARLLTYYAAFFSRRYVSPHPCPAFSLSNLGSLDPEPSLSDSVTVERLPKAMALPELIQHVSKGFPHLEDIHIGVTTGSAFPVPLITSVTIGGKLRVTVSFQEETMSRSWAEAYTDKFMSLLCKDLED